MKLGAVVLAAGNSERMGRPKALLELAGDTFLGTVCRRLYEAGVYDVTVVLGKDAEAILSGWRRGNEKVVVNSRPDDGMISSLKCALRALPAETLLEGVLVCLVDTPLVRADTFRALIDTWSRHQGFMAVVRHNGKRGHPLVLDQRYWHETLLAPLDEGLHWVTHRHADALLDVDVDDPGVLKDVDTPEEYQGLVTSGK